ncbi:MAG: putative rane protein, partial [candidate division NC10 bacterium]|nr:putative rane protein [candidate division NC10 bacterium]
MRRRRLVFLVTAGVIVCCCTAFATLPVMRHFPLPLRPFASALYGNARGKIARLGEHAATLLFPNASAANPLNLLLRGDIEEMVLQDLKLTYRLGATSGGSTDLPFLDKLPAIRRLDVRNAEIVLAFEGKDQHVKLTNVDVAIRDFLPSTGGSIAFRANFAATTAGDAVIAARGRITGDFALTGAHPKPDGKGTVELVVDSAGYTSGNRTVSLSGFTVAAELTYDRATETFAINALRGESQDFGTVLGAARVALRGDMPWNASFSAGSIDFARAFAVIRSLLPEAYRAWAVQGQGALEVGAEGRFVEGQPSLDGAAKFSLTQGGVSSPDGAKAAQGVAGGVALKVARASSEQKVRFSVRAEQRDGEYLWGTYYSNLSGHRSSLVFDGEYAWDGEPRFELNGSADAFQTGDYSFAAHGKGSDWSLLFKAAGVSHARIVDTVLKEYLKGLSPRLSSLSVTGVSALETVIRYESGAMAITGTYSTDGAGLNAPDMSLSVRSIAANVPFALRYPSGNSSASVSPRSGFVRLEGLQRRRLTVDDLRIPLVISENRLEVPEPVTVPFFGGQVHLYGLQVDDVLFPSRYRFGAKIANVDLGRMTRRLTGVEYPGTVNADLGMMRYENNRIASEGKAVVAVFGGEIEATDLFAENILSSSRKMGGSITFRDISLEQLTQKIAVGKITGVIQGSLKNFAMEYGEPASFVLEVESVAKRGVAQSISTDAIQSISILGTGADSALNRGIT